MAFFLIVPSVMILSIVLLHAIAAHFGFQLKYKALILCALSSIGISLAALRTSAFVDKMFFVKIAVMIVAAALLSSLLNRSKPAPVEKPVETEEEDNELIIHPLIVREDGHSTEAEVVKRRMAELKSQKLMVRRMTDVDKNSKTASDVPKVNKKISAPVERTVDRKNFSSFDQKTSTIEQKIAVSSEPIGRAKRPTVTEKKAAHLATANEKISAAIDKSKSDKNSDADSKRKATGESGITEEELAAVDSHLHSLDNILEFAADNKEAGNFKLAIYCYQRALERYREDDYAPFIAVDLSSLYKEQAAYIKAIKVFEEALKLPAVVRSDAARKECMSNLAYLRVVQSVLLKHRALSTPFSKISRQLRAEIDAEFKKQSVFSAV